MAERRMMSKSILESDAFIDMPLSAQALYVHLSVRADDDGFINNPRMIIRMINASKTDFEILIKKQFIILFEDGICVIKHWLLHNYIRPDRYKATLYKDDKSLLILGENKAYLINEELSKYTSNNGIPKVARLEHQDSKGKDKLNKDSKGKRKVKRVKSKRNSQTKSKANKEISEEVIENIINKWNSLGVACIINIRNARLKLLNKRINEYGLDKVTDAIDSISRSSFLRGYNERNWRITFDWFLKSSNFTKVLEGNFLDKADADINKEQNFLNQLPDGHDYVSLEKTLLGWDK